MNQPLFYEMGTHLRIVEDVDVLVCGGGPAGIAAALAAARNGASVRLIELAGCLGGVWTSGLLAFILDSQNKRGLLLELLTRLERAGARRALAWGGVPYDPEAMKLVLEQWCLAEGIRLRLHTRLAATHVDDERRLCLAMTESKSGREAWAAKVFVDATGDGDLAARAGCGFDVGRPGSGQTQPMSLMALLGGVALDALGPWLHDGAASHGSDTARMLATLAQQGVVPSYGAPIVLPVHAGLVALMANHEYGVSATEAQQVTDATLHARAEVHALAAALRAAGGPWSGVQVVATAAQIGTREGRRIHGRYHVTADDVRTGRRHPDAVCRVTFPVDVHSTDPDDGTTYASEGLRSQPYDIPLRALLAADVDGLVLAGRCLSGDFLAHASYRVTGNAVALGEAAGTLAAVAARSDRLPHEVGFEELPGHANWATDPASSVNTP